MDLPLKVSTMPKRKKLKGNKKFGKVMHEFKGGTLHHGGSGEVVKREDVAHAIAASEQRKADERKKKRKR